jgi:hypothetical protein
MSPQQPRFKLSRQALLLGIISAALPSTGYCIAAGHADFVIGNVEVIGANGVRRILTKGADINAGDSINTGPNARAQVRFIDGGFVSLQPTTVFRVDEYNYNNKTDGEEKGFFSLLKGGLRAITGAIGHVNRKSYRVATPSATIGIRGTGYRAEIKGEGLLISVGEGAVLLTNNTGPIVITAGNAAFVANMNTRPTPTTEQPHTPPASIEPLSTPLNFIQQAATPKLASGSGYKMSYTDTSGGSTSSANIASVSAVFNNLEQLTQFTDSSGNGLALGAASVAFSATDGIIGWGRWNGTPTQIGTAYVAGSVDYIIGLPTAVMPTSGTATYNLMGYTNPRASDGSTGWTVAGTVGADFSAQQVKINLTVANNTDSYSLTNIPLGIISGSYGSTGLTTSSSTGSCSSGCSSSINGFFVGDNASRTGLSYNITGGTQDVSGVAAYAKAP